MPTGKTEMKPHIPPRVKSPILEDSKRRGHGPGGSQTPGAKKKAKEKKAKEKIKDGSADGHRLTGVNQ